MRGCFDITNSDSVVVKIGIWKIENTLYSVPSSGINDFLYSVEIEVKRKNELRENKCLQLSLSELSS